MQLLTSAAQFPQRGTVVFSTTTENLSRENAEPVSQITKCGNQANTNAEASYTESNWKETDF